MIGVAPVGWFDIASDVALKIKDLSLGWCRVRYLPAASELKALGDKHRTKELYYRTHKYLALFGVPIVFSAGAFSARFVELWLGSSMRVIAFPLALLVTINFLNLTSGPAFLIFAGSGYLKPAIQSSLLGIVLDVVLSLGLIYKFGFAGAALGTSVSLLLAAVFDMEVSQGERLPVRPIAARELFQTCGMRFGGYVGAPGGTFDEKFVLVWAGRHGVAFWSDLFGTNSSQSFFR